MNKEVVYDYLQKEELKEHVIEALIHRLSQCPEIFDEFEGRITAAEPLNPVSILVGEEAFTAEKLMKYPCLSKLYKAYSYLAFLKEDPIYALLMLKEGFPLED